MSEKELVPKRRFKEFENDGEWEEKKLGEVADRFDNLRIPIAESKRISGITPYYGANGIVDYINGFTHDGEFILIAEDGANDLKNYPIYYINGKVWVNNHAHVIQGKENLLNNMFLGYLLKTIDIYSYLVGGSRAKLNANIMMELIINICELSEQEKIGNFFQSLDKLISLNQDKLNKLKRTKSAYLSEMFPKEGELYPKRRFAGFTEPWEEKKLGDIADIVGGDTPSTVNLDYWNGNIDWYSPTEIGNKVYANGSIKRITKLGLEKSSARILPGNKTVLFTSRAGIGDMAILKRDGTTNQGFQSLVLNEKIDTYFIYSMGYLIKKYALRVSSGSTFLEISGKKLAEMDILIPPLSEQEKIGNFFKELDKLINLQDTKLKKLEDLKKAYLNEMFV